MCQNRIAIDKCMQIKQWPNLVKLVIGFAMRSVGAILPSKKFIIAFENNLKNKMKIIAKKII